MVNGRDPPSVEKIVEALRHDDRHPVDDADCIESMSGFERVEVVHEGSDGNVILGYRLDAQFRTDRGESTTSGAGQFDIFEWDREGEDDPLDATIDALVHGHRDPVGRVSTVYGGLHTLEVHHVLREVGRVILRYRNCVCHRTDTDDGGAAEFDVLGMG